MGWAGSHKGWGVRGWGGRDRSLTPQPRNVSRRCWNSDGYGEGERLGFC